MGEELPLLPETQPTDDEDVVWGLQTATALWARGERREALIWVRRAAEAAGAAGDDMRAVDLAKRAVSMEEYIQAIEAAPPPSIAAPKPLISFPESAASVVPVQVAPLQPLPGAPAAAPTVPGTLFDIADDLTTDYEGELDPELDRASLYEGELDPIADRASGPPPGEDHGGGDELTVPRLDIAQMQKILDGRSRPPPGVAPVHGSPPHQPPASQAQAAAHPSQHPSAPPSQIPPSAMPSSTMPRGPAKTPPMGMQAYVPPTSHRGPKTPPMGQPAMQVDPKSSADAPSYVPVPSPTLTSQPAVRQDTPRIPPVSANTVPQSLAAPQPVVSAVPPTAPSPQAQHLTPAPGVISQPSSPTPSVVSAPAPVSQAMAPASPLGQTTPSFGNATPPPGVLGHSTPPLGQPTPAPIVIDSFDRPPVSERAPGSTARLASKVPPPPPKGRSATLQPGAQHGYTPVTPPTTAVASSAAVSSSVAVGEKIGESTGENLSATAQRAARKKPRAPILDPWADDFPVDDAPNPRQTSQSIEAGPGSEDDVFTSAAPLDSTLRRKPPPPPPQRRVAGTVLADSPPMSTPEPARSNGDGAAAHGRPPPPPPVRKPTLSGAPNPLFQADGERKSVPPPPTNEGRKSVPPPPIESPAHATTPPPGQVKAAPAVVSERPKSAPPPPPDRSKSAPPPPVERLESAPAPAPERPKSAPPPPPDRSKSVPPPAPPPPAPERRRTTPPPGDDARTSPGFEMTPQPKPRTVPPPTKPVTVAPAARVESRPPGNSVPPAERSVAGLPLDRIDAFADLPGELQRTLAKSAELLELNEGEEAQGFGLLLVTGGVVDVCANIADIAAAMAVQGSLVSSFTSVTETVAIRAVAPGRARVALFSRESTEDALKSCPWVLDELVRMGDRFAALVGATMGPLGDLDDESRRQTLDRFRVRGLRAGELLAAKGSDNQGLIVVGAGSIVLPETNGVLSSGDLLFPDTVLDGSPTPHDVRAGDGGALILSASRSTTVELFSTFPMLLELLRVA